MSDRFQPRADSGGGGGSGITELTQDVLAGPGSGSVAATVVGLQTVGISAVAPTNGQALVYNSGTGLWTPTTPTAGGGASVYPPLDANDLGYWDFSEASGNFINQGTAAGVDITPIVGSPAFYGQAGPFGKCAYIGQSGAQSAPTAAITPAQFTFSVLVKPTNTNNGAVTTYFALRDPGLSSSPMNFYWANTIGNDFFPNNINWYAFFSVVGGFPNYEQLDISSAGNPDWRAVQWGQWNMLTSTYDGATYKAYINGGLVASLASIRPPDYSAPGLRVQVWQNCLVALLRIRNVVMSADDIRLAYRKALAWA